MTRRDYVNNSSVALYWDFENLHASLLEDAQGDGAYGKPDGRFKAQEPYIDVQAVIDLASSFGPIAINRAYGNWQWFGRYRDALSDFNTALQLKPDFHQAYANRALVYRFMGDLGNAASDYNRAIQLNPRYDADYIGRGNLYRKAGRTNEAFNDFEQAIKLDTTDPRAYHNRGLIYQSRKQHDYAISDFSTAISLDPEAP